MYNLTIITPHPSRSIGQACAFQALQAAIKHRCQIMHLF
jgi:hypothetical protein